jgi:hypothetical protein
VIARALMRRRGLAARWRGPDGVNRAVVWARTRRASAPLCGPGRSLLVFSIPLLDGNGELVEELLVPVAAPLACADLRHARSGVDTTMAETVRHAIQRRLAKAMRSISDRAAAMSHRESLLHAAFRSHRVTEVQPGLFSQQELRAFDDQLDESTQLLAQAGARTSRVTRGSDLRPGEPALEVALLVEP